MYPHPNARLTPIARERLIRQHLNEGRSLAQLATDHGITDRTYGQQVVGTVPLRRANGTGGLTKCSPHPGADTRSAAAAAGCGLQAPALHPPEDRPAADATDHHPGQGDAAPGAEPAAEPRPHAAGAAIPVGAAGRHNPCRHQPAGPVQPCWAPGKRVSDDNQVDGRIASLPELLAQGCCINAWREWWPCRAVPRAAGVRP